MAEAGLMHDGAVTTALEDAAEAVRLADLDPVRALPAAERAVARARRERNPEAESIARRAWGHALMHCGELDTAIRHLRRSIECGRRAGSPRLAGEAETKLAHAMVQRGRPKAALAAVERALPNLAGASKGRALAQRAIILHLSGRLEEAAAGFDAALPVLRRAGDLLGIQRMLINRAFLHADRHAFALAHADLLEAETLARRLGRNQALGIIEANRGFFESLRGDVPAALTHFERAERITTAHGAQVGTIHQDRSELLLSTGLVSEARLVADQAVRAYQRERRFLKIPEVRLLLAQAAFLSGDHASAVEHADRARREFAQQGRAEWVELARLAGIRARLASGSGVAPRMIQRTVEVIDRAGWPAAALEARLVAGRMAARVEDRRRYLAEAGRAARRGPAVLRARGWYAKALLRLDGGGARGAAQPGSQGALGSRSALGAVRTGLRILDEHSAAMGAADLRAHSAVHRAELAELGLRIALGSGRPGRVLEWAERGRASQLMHRAARPPEDAELARMLSELRATATEVDRGARHLVQRQVELERRIRDHTRQRPGVHEVQRALRPVTAGRLGEALGEWALVEFVQLDGVLHGLSVTDGRVRLRPLGPAELVTGLVERLPFALHRLARRGSSAAARDAALALLRGAAGRLDAALLRPLAKDLGDRPLVVVPTGPLHSVPWSILPSCAGRPVAVSPSATLWHATTTRPHAEASTSIAVAAGPKLRGAREEAEAVAKIHGTSPLVDATAAAVLDALGSAEVVHLAAHGRLSADNPLFSDLLLADGPLVVHDLEQVPRVPHTVVLAACDSGRSVVRAGDELLGLSAAFVARGAAQLVASVLPIPDAQTAPLMIAFHERLAGGEAPAVALAAVQRQLIADRDPATLAASAGFVCLGAGVLAPRLR
jgi:tetratricopeptide (TPR) repeat protein